MADLTLVLGALASPQRLRVLAELGRESVHVSELARRVGMSRPLLYGHLTRLEQAGLVVGHHSVSPDGKALRHFEVVPFDLHVTPATVARAVAESPEEGS
ncbi:ArsR/SmtB family transcription factor [Cellulomonas triticagri]|uniref:ArsR/SmtB family transcription factor n=1 Tax=Cellulomonas triticagri TaxID=2483352 RepID=UPI001F4798E6|nr:winged helix-turn-helix domain-containing protein [Cellulomonas triticagri]